MSRFVFSSFFFFNDTATTEIYTLSLHDALPIYKLKVGGWRVEFDDRNEKLSYKIRAAQLAKIPYAVVIGDREVKDQDRKSTRLNSSHGYISYAVFCLKKKKKKYTPSLIK